MTTLPSAHHNNRGFTLFETILYIGLFGIMFTGIFVSIYPFFTGAERLTRNIATEGETAFVLAKIHYALATGIKTSSDNVTTPTQGNSADTLVIKNGTNELFRFEQNDANGLCAPPLVCPTIDFVDHSIDATPRPLNATRITFENFEVTQSPAGAVAPYLDITFTANEVDVGPVRYYLHF